MTALLSLSVRKSALAAWAVLLALAFPVTGSELQNVRFERLSMDRGLSQGTVNTILQDRRGFMWFGTQDGLNRYDGYSFTVYKHDPEDPRSLSNSSIWALLEDEDGSLWIGTDGGGLDRWDPQTGTFLHFRNDASNPNSLSNDRVRAILRGRDGSLWIGTDGGGLNRFDRARRTFQRFVNDPGNPNSLSNDRVRSLVQDADGTLWIGTDGGGLDRLEPGLGIFRHYRHDPADPRSLSDDRVRVVYNDRSGALWVGTYQKGLNRLDRRTGKFELFLRDPADPGSLGQNRVVALYQDRSGTLWVGTDAGLSEWRPERRRFVTYSHDAADPASLSDSRVMSIYQDRGGVFWVGTQGGGVNKWNISTASFTPYEVEPSAPTTLPSNTITSLYQQRDGVLWIGTYEGLGRFDRRTRTYRTFRNDPRDPHSLSDSRVMSLLVDRQGRLWAGTLDGGLNRFDPTTGRFERFQHEPGDPRSLSGNGVTTIYQDRSGAIWVGVYRGGLNRFEPATGTFVQYRHDPAEPTSLSNDSVLAIEEDAAGMLWIGTEGGGLNRFDRRSGTFTRYRNHPADPQSLSGDIVFSIREDRRGVLWIGTQGAGLNRWNPADRAVHRAVFKRYTERQGLPNGSIYGILEDGAGRLWLSTNHGLSQFDPRAETFRNFGTSHGLRSDEFNFGAWHRGVGGEMFFGGNAGFISFLPRQIRRNTHVPPMVLTSFSRLNQDVELGPALANGIRLGHKDYVISFGFAALDYSAPEKNRYAYKLDGFDADWIEADGVRRATYTNLDPGHYVFRVKGSNNDGVWNEQGLALPITVLPPPWKTWWAYSLYALAVVALIALYLRSQARERRREIEHSRMLEQQVQDRTRELEQRNSELHEANCKLKEASLTDSLTGLRNRRYLMNHIQEDLAQVDRIYAERERGNLEASVAGPDLAILMLDLDGLKEINDTYGHMAGDRALVQVCGILARTCRRSETLHRWGGDEFLIIARMVTRGVAEVLAERIRRAVEAHPFDLGLASPVHLSCSIGFAFYPFLPTEPTAATWEQVVTIADQALYIAKNIGRNAWVGLVAGERARRAGDLVRAIGQDLDSLVQQKVIEVRSSRPDACEPLERGRPLVEIENVDHVAHAGM